MTGYDLLTKFRELSPNQQDLCIQYFMGGISMDYEGWTDAKERPNYLCSKYCIDEFILALGYARKQPKEKIGEPMSRPQSTEGRRPLDHDYTSYCIKCNTNRINKVNKLGICADCFGEMSIEERETAVSIPKTKRYINLDDAGQMIHSDDGINWEPCSFNANVRPNTSPQKGISMEAISMQIADERTSYTNEEINKMSEEAILSEATPNDGQVQFTTGARRAKQELPLTMMPPFGQFARAAASGEGAFKYADYNNLKGFPTSDIINHLLIHLYLYFWGDTTEDHLSHAAWNMDQLLYQQNCNVGVDDRPTPNANIINGLNQSLIRYRKTMNDAIEKVKVEQSTFPQKVIDPEYDCTKTEQLHSHVDM